MPDQHRQERPVLLAVGPVGPVEVGFRSPESLLLT